MQGLEARPTVGAPPALAGLSNGDMVALGDLGQATECNGSLNWTLNGA